MDNEDLAKRLDEAAASATYEVDLRDALDRWRNDGSLEPSRAKCLVEIFGYSLSSFDQSDRREANGGAFTPMYSFNDGRQWPPPMREIPEACLAVAAEVARHAQDPMVVARISDFLWERRFGDNSYLHGRRAALAYLEFPSRSGPDYHDLTCVQMADRALEIAMQISSADLRAESRSVLVQVSRDSMNGDRPGLGVIARAARALLRLPDDEVPVELDELLDRADEVFGGDPWAAKDIYDLRIEKERGEPDQKKELGREQIEALIQAASNAPNVFLKHAYLEQAAALTHSRGGSSEDAQRIARLIEASPVRSEDFSRVTTDLEWSREELEALVQHAGSLPSWQAALEWFGSRGPPTGDPKDHLEDVERQKQTAPLQFLIPKMLYGSGGLPLRLAETEEERIEYAVAMNERLALQIWGHIYERILVRVTERSDFPGMGELTEFFSGPLVSMNVADALARAVVHFRAHAFDEAAHVLIPRIEAIVRSVAEAMDIATASLPIGHTQGGYVSLGTLFSRLRPVGLPDEPWRRYGEHLLTDSLGANLRNEICHGLRPTVSPSEAALLVITPAISARSASARQRHDRTFGLEVASLIRGRRRASPSGGSQSSAAQ